MQKQKKIGILNGGGDCAGLNGVIAAATKYGISLGYQMIGIEKGWEGLLNPMMTRELTRDSVRAITHLGGTIIKTTNKGRFTGKKGAGDPHKIADEVLQEAKDNYDKLGLDGLIVIGGDGTLSGANQLIPLGVNMVGVPKTIDNDIFGTDQTFGFSTAVDVVAESLDRIHTTATSHDRVLIVETMGRHTGWIALYGGLAGLANFILIPEIPFSYNAVIEGLRYRKSLGRTSTVIVVAEGANAINEDIVIRNKTGNESEEVRLGGISRHLMDVIDRNAPNEFEMREVILAHLQRGGSPNPEDRILSQRYGIAAVDALVAGNFGQMIALKDCDLTTIPISEAVKELKRVTTDHWAYKAARNVGISFGA